MLMPTSDMTYQPSTEVDRVMMRGMSEPVIIHVDQLQEAKQFESELLRLGVKVHQNSTAKKHTLRITLSYPVKNEVRVLLEARIIQVPSQGDLTVVFVPFTQ